MKVDKDSFMAGIEYAKEIISQNTDCAIKVIVGDAIKRKDLKLIHDEFMGIFRVISEGDILEKHLKALDGIQANE